MDIIQRFEALVREQEWAQARALAKEIVEAAPHISTSWFNLAVTHEALQDFQEAANCFRKAYDIDPYDAGVQFRLFRSLSLAGDVRGFTRLAESECALQPGLLPNLLSAPEFADMVNDKWFKFRFRGKLDA